MSAITHVRFYPSDWLAGTRGMTAAQTGVYITLIAMMYERCGPISCADMPKLARLCGTSSSALAGLLDSLISDGKITREGDMLSNRRAMLEIENVMAKSEVAKDKANARWQKKPEKSTVDACSGNADAMLTNSHKPIISSLRSDIARKTRKAPVKAVAYSPDFEIFWDSYPPVANQSKAKAFEAFCRLDKPDKATAIDGAMALCQWLEAERPRKPNVDQFIPHAATWLNQRRWESLLEPNHRARYEQRSEVH